MDQDRFCSKSIEDPSRGQGGNDILRYPSPMKTITIDQVPLFQALPVEELRFLEKAFRRTEIAAGHILFQEGDQGDQFFVILSGELEVFKALEATGELVISLRGPGDFVGEMSMLMRDGLRTASVRARTNVEVLGLSHRI